MTFVSYAQNYEDVMLYRALKNVEKGVYVDIGANDPIIDSVTKAFYERGWRGINIEPIRHWYDKLLVDRPEDMNLNVAISDQPGVLSLYEVQDTGLSTSNKENAEKYLQDLGFQYQEILVPALTLESVLQGFDRDIHFLKVDVEGAERQVLASIDLTRTRPWVILVEATKPMSVEKDYVGWDTLLIDQGYVFVYFDGLNRFYIPVERNDLSPFFSSPPNVFDNFVRFSEWNAQISLKNYEEKQGQLEVALNDKEVERLQLENTFNNKEIERLQLENALNNKENERLELENALNNKENERLESENALNNKENERLESENALNNKESERLKLETMLRFHQERAERIDKYLEELELSATTRQRELQNYADELGKKLSAVDMNLSRLKIELQSVYDSTSWKISKPIRSAGIVLRRIAGALKFLLKKILGRPILFLRARPKMKERLVSLLAKIPIMDRMVLRVSRSVLNAPQNGSDYTSQQQHPVLLENDNSSQQHHPVILEKDFRQSLQRAAHEWRLGVRVDDK